MIHNVKDFFIVVDATPGRVRGRIMPTASIGSAKIVTNKKYMLYYKVRIFNQT